MPRGDHRGRGVSGSGKSSLAFDTLAAEAWHRFAESLPFEVRRHVQRMPRPELDGAEGLGPVITLGQDRARAGRRSTVATQSELGPLLRLLFSRAGTLDGAPVDLSAGHFSPDRSLGACAACEGLGSVERCDPDRLITDPSAPLTAGAMDGTRVGRYLGEPDGQFLATLRAAGPEVDWDRPFGTGPAHRRSRPRGRDPGAHRDRPLGPGGRGQGGRGEGGPRVRGRVGGPARPRRARGPPAREGRRGGKAEPLAAAPCPACEGARLGAVARRVSLGGATLPELLDQPWIASSGRSRSEPRRPPEGGARRAAARAARADGGHGGLGLGHLQLSAGVRPCPRASLQRTRLASVLRSGLSGVTLVLDEPTSGLHARDVDGLLVHLRRFVERGNTAVLVEHEPRVLRAADHLIELGPGAGERGGEVVAAGSPEDVLAGDGPTAAALAGARERARRQRRAPSAGSSRAATRTTCGPSTCPCPAPARWRSPGSRQRQVQPALRGARAHGGEGRRSGAARPALDGGAPPVFSAVRSRAGPPRRARW